jgi:thioredoxin 1
MKEIKTEEELKTIITSTDVAVLKVGAPWCGPCRMLESIISEIESENIDSAEFIEVNVDEADEEFVDSLRVRNVPVLIFYKNGEAVDRTVGLVTKQELLDKISNLK